MHQSAAMPQRLENAAIRPSRPIATTPITCPRSSGIRAGSPASMPTDLATTVPSTQRFGLPVKSAGSQSLPWALPAAQTKTVLSVEPACASAAIEAPRPARSSCSEYCSIMPFTPKLMFEKSMVRPPAVQPVTASAIDARRLSARRRPDGEIGL